MKLYVKGVVQRGIVIGGSTLYESSLAPLRSGETGTVHSLLFSNFLSETIEMLDKHREKQGGILEERIKIDSFWDSNRPHNAEKKALEKIIELYNLAYERNQETV